MFLPQIPLSRLAGEAKWHEEKITLFEKYVIANFIFIVFSVKIT